jgi:hypothetical protein
MLREAKTAAEQHKTFAISVCEDPALGQKYVFSPISSVHKKNYRRQQGSNLRPQRGTDI